jgi:uncharacterized repeat protein (TIGR03803 family)
LKVTEGKNNCSPLLSIPITRRRRGAGIILAIFTILFLMGTGAAGRAQAQTYIVLHNFTVGTNDGVNPQADLVRDSAGNLYGTTFVGGSNGDGTVFKLDPSGTLTVLHSFDGSDGANPQAGLVMDSHGALYGTTRNGGSNDDGTVFKLDPSGTLILLHNFAGSPTDGATPEAGLVRNSHGNLYGTTEKGGSNDDGTVFKLDTSDTLTVLHSFDGSDGANPHAGLVMDSHGNLYGTTSAGGSGYGTVFELNTSGAHFAVLHPFTGATNDGANPQAGLVMDSHGNLYGTTQKGGSNGDGTVFELNTSGGGFAVLHNFTVGTNDGVNPQADLVRDAHGNLYGTTGFGGASTSCDGTCGTAFQLDPSGTLTLLHSFDGSDGAKPMAGLVMDSQGNLYGTTLYGGSNNDGTVFVLSTTPQGAIQFIITQVNSLLAQGAINRQQDNPLVQELHLAIAKTNAGKIDDAITDLTNFISQVTALENSGVLTGDQASALINAATDVIAQLQ